MQQENQLLTIDDVRAKLKVSRRTIYNLIAAKKLKPRKLSTRCVRFRQTDIDKYINSNN